jgi:hypothetical protein
MQSETSVAEAQKNKKINGVRAEQKMFRDVLSAIKDFNMIAD